jgi:hypothetical protein
MCTTSRILSLKLTASLRSLIRILSLFVSHPCLIFLNNTCISFTPNQVHSLVRVPCWAISWWVHQRPPVCPISAHVPLISNTIHLKAMSFWSHTWLRVSIQSYHPREDHLKFLPWWRMSSLTLEHENVLFHSKYPLELLDHDRVMKLNTSRVTKHHPVLQVAMSPTHGRKSYMCDRKVFLLSTVPLFFLLCGQCVFHRFLFTHRRKSQYEISFKGEGCNTMCYSFHQLPSLVH